MVERRLQPGPAARTPLLGAERKSSEPRKSSPIAPFSLQLQRIRSGILAFVAEILGFSVLRAANLQRICCKNPLQMRCGRATQRRAGLPEWAARLGERDSAVRDP